MISVRCVEPARLTALVGLALILITSAPPALGQGQTVRGRVIDRDAQASLPGANVVILGTDPLLGTSTDAQGTYVISNVPLGRHDVQVSFLGYAPVIVPEVLFTAGKEVIIDVALEEQIVTGEEVVVRPDVRKDQPLNDMAVVSARSFSVEETRRYAGGLDDPARMASAFAGITSTSGSLQDNALVIRGNAPKGVQWRLEGVEIPNPNHFAGMTVAGGGGLTLFSSQLLADADVFTAAFPAEYGDALAGVFDMRFRSGNRAAREHALQASLLGIEAASEGPFVGERPSTYLFNYRYSTIALLLPLLPTESEVRYQDLSFKLDFPTRRAGRFEVWGLGGLDRQTMAEERDSTAWEYDLWDRTRFDLDLGVGVAGAAHHFAFGRNTYLRTTLALTARRTAWNQQRLDDDVVLQPDLRVHDTSGRVVAGAYLNHKSGARHVNRTGIAVQRLFYDLHLKSAPSAGAPLQSVAEGHGHSLLLRWYSQSKVDLSPRLTANVGVHAQHFTLTGRTAVEPRLGLRWLPAVGHIVSIGYGLHSQIDDLRIYFARRRGTLPNRNLDFTRAHHAVVGYDRHLGEMARIKLEAYYQYLFGVPVVRDSSFSMLNFVQDWRFDESLVNDGAGRNYGIEATLERFLRDGYYYLVTASLYRSRYRGGDHIWRNTRFDQRYSANGLFGREIQLGTRHSLLGINGRVTLTGGRRRSPVDGAASRTAEAVIFDETRAFTDAEPGLMLLDLTLTWRRNHRRRAEVWALQVKNVLAAKDVVLDYNYATDEVEEVLEGYPVPVLSYKVEW